MARGQRANVSFGALGVAGPSAFGEAPKLDVGLIFVVTNTIVDLLYGLVNPTINLLGKGE